MAKTVDKPKKSKKAELLKAGVGKTAGKKKKNVTEAIAAALDPPAEQTDEDASLSSPTSVKKRKSDVNGTSKKSKKVKASESDDAATEPSLQAEEAPPSPNSLDNFDLNSGIKQLLQDKGITSLFDIQSACYPHALAGKDIVGRARTGCGKTLAFVLPIVELLIREKVRPASGLPSVICLLPTRELAKQVHEEFEYIGQAGSMRTVCVYGGSPYQPQEQAIRRGAHVVVGTPGRVKDHIERGTLKMSKLRFRVLDECDEMLNMGFADDVEKILGAVAADAATSERTVQTMLFSATMPPWVRELQKKYLGQDATYVDLVGSDKMKASKSVEHKVLYCHWSQRSSIIQDLVKCYGFSGRTIIFCDTKNDANELAASLSETVGARALHGDIPQSQREVTLKAFRDGKFAVLVATDVAARGLDISCVDLVLQMDPPKDYETYIHRSGRTGRAGSTGVSITMVSRNKEDRIPYIQSKAGFTFERIGSPQPSEMAQVAARRAVETIQEVGDSVVPWFLTAAKELLAAHDSPEIALAKALAKLTGNVEMKRRSLLTAHEDFTTFQFDSPSPLDRPGYVFGFLRRRLPESLVDQVKGMRLTKDLRGAVFDVPSSLVDEFVAKVVNAEEERKDDKPGQQAPCRVRIAEELPELKPRDDEGQEGNSSWGGRGGGSWGGRGGGRGGFGGRGGGFGGRAGGRGGGGRSSGGSGGRGNGRGRGRY